ncbi:MAG: Hsp20/alpha crystallin family protein [Bacteroidota bacterium]
MNIKENDTNYEVALAVPGMNKEDFQIHLDNNTLTVSVEQETKNETTKDERTYSRREFSYQSFQRSFNLPKDVVDEDNISAKYQDGILSIHVPKKSEAEIRTRKQIAIQ